MLERKSDTTQERSDPPISVAAHVLIERRTLITVVGVAACAIHKAHVGKISGTPRCSSKGLCPDAIADDRACLLISTFIKEKLCQYLVCLPAVSLMR